MDISKGSEGGQRTPDPAKAVGKAVVKVAIIASLAVLLGALLYGVWVLGERRW